jgi:flagellar hook-associated protein 3 FlgL
MRVTEGMQYDSALRSLGDLASRQADAQTEATTGSRLTSPSNDPIASAEYVRMQSSLSQANSRRSTIQTVQGDATLAEGSLSQAADLFAQAKSLAIQGANGTLSASDRATLAKQVDGLRDTMISIANTKGASGYLFGGSQTQTAPFDPTTGAFSGDNAEHVVDIGGSTPTSVGTSGAQAFTAAGGQDVFAALSTLSDALNANDTTAITGSVSGLDAASSQIVSVQGQAGLTMAKLTSSDSALAQLQTRISTQESAVGAADPVAAYSSLSSLSTSLQNAVAVTKQILGNSAFSRF